MQQHENIHSLNTKTKSKKEKHPHPQRLNTTELIFIGIVTFGIGYALYKYIVKDFDKKN